MATGVYVIENTSNGKVYVGSAAVCLRKRLWTHRRKLRFGQHHNQHLQNAWDKYGESCFTFRVVENCDPDLCVPREQVWIDDYKSYDREFGYNNSPTAGSPLGVKHTVDARAAMSAASKGRKKSESHAANIKKAKANISEATRAKLSLRASNKSPEWRARLSASNKARWVIWKQDGRAAEVVKKIKASKAAKKGDGHGECPRRLFD